MALVNRNPGARNLPDYQIDAAKQQRFSPYTDNGGSLVAIAGPDFAIVASDTRLSSGYSIHTRGQNKVFQLSETTVLGSAGCWCDAITLVKVLQARLQMYKHEHNKVMSTTACAQMLSTMLYHKRFFPYYCTNILAGLDEDGKGAVYFYDPIGHTERCNHGTAGSAGPLLQSLLDNQVDFKNQQNVEKIPLTIEKALTLVKDLFISASERDIYTGDSVAIKIITKDGIKSDSFELRRD